MLSGVDAPYLGSGRFLRRVGAFGLLAIACFFLLGLRLWAIEVVNPQPFVRQGEQESTRAFELPAPRGAIISSDGALLAGTQGSLAVALDARTLGSPASGAWHPTAVGASLIQRLSGLSGTPPASILERIRTDLVQNPFGEAIVLTNVPEPLGSYLSERESSFPGLSVVTEPERSYPQGALGGAFIGLVGQLSAAESSSDAYPWAQVGQQVGQSGVEASYDQVLNGGVGLSSVHVNALGELVGELSHSTPTRHPATLQLTINLGLQRAAQAALAAGIQDAHEAGYPNADAGAAVVMNPRTGAIEALASAPELNQAAAGDDGSYLESLLGDSDGDSALFNQATQGLFPLGSTFKPVVAEAALSAGLITPWTSLQCLGSLTVGGIVFHNVEGWIDEPMDLAQALEISCDTWFYQLGERVFFLQQQGQLDIQSWAELFGFGKPTGIDLPAESAGLVPTPSWLEKSEHEQWYEGDSVNLSIGQGFLEATPLQLAVAYAALANGGTIVHPHLGEAVIRGGRRTELSFPPVRRLALRDLGTIDEGLVLAAHGPGGTSSAVFADYPVTVAGKTGTAQVAGGNDDSWYASFAPAADPKVVVVVLIEDGGYGADAAAPAARDIYDAYFHIHP